MRTIGLTLASLLILPAVLIRIDQRHSGARAQQKIEDDAGQPIKIDVDVVNLYCAVRNKQNALLSNLEKSDFSLAEDGVPQIIKYFTRETDLPLTIGLLVDVSGSQQNLIEPERRAASSFFSSVLKKKDVAFLISFGADSELLQDITGSPRVLQDGLNRLKLNGGFAGINGGPVPTANKPRGTVLYDAVYVAANDMLAKEVGRKAIVLITDGEDQGSRETEKAAIEAAQKADAIIYGILYVDRQFYDVFGPGYSGESTLKHMSEETGGRVFHVDRRNPLDSIFDQIQREMRTQYAIGYAPTNGKKDGSYRKLDLRTVNKDLKVQVRKGYYAMPNAQ
ncbi:MAG: VWA domain-containing protein [Acidobacteriota bacterium]|nr:VWA domain-containing protein [Acidobacteriota bacterium]